MTTVAFIDNVQVLADRIAELVLRRQDLRAAAADAATLEANRLEIVQLQSRLSDALIRRYGSAAAA